MTEPVEQIVVSQEDREVAAELVARHIEAWGWGPLDDIEGLAEHTLAVDAAATALAQARSDAIQMAAGKMREAARDAWDDICSDTGCHPLDIRREGKKLYFEPNHWFDGIAAAIRALDGGGVK